MLAYIGRRLLLIVPTLFGIMVGVVVAHVRTEIATHVRPLATGTLVTIAILAVGWSLFTYMQGQYDLNVNARYLLPLLPLIAIVVIRSVRRFGLVMLGIVFPASAAIWQIAGGKF